MMTKVTSKRLTKAMVGGSMVVQGVVTIAWLGVAVSLGRRRILFEM